MNSGGIMDRTPVTSSAIRSVGYDPATKELDVELGSGQVYRYSGVEPEAHEQFMKAESPGRHFQISIRACYPSKRLPKESEIPSDI
jgi:hypothetical protein